MKEKEALKKLRAEMEKIINQHIDEMANGNMDCSLLLLAGKKEKDGNSIMNAVSFGGNPTILKKQIVSILEEEEDTPIYLLKRVIIAALDTVANNAIIDWIKRQARNN